MNIANDVAAGHTQRHTAPVMPIKSEVMESGGARRGGPASPSPLTYCLSWLNSQSSAAVKDS